MINNRQDLPLALVDVRSFGMDCWVSMKGDEKTWIVQCRNATRCRTEIQEHRTSAQGQRCHRGLKELGYAKITGSWSSESSQCSRRTLNSALVRTEMFLVNVPLCSWQPDYPNSIKGSVDHHSYLSIFIMLHLFCISVNHCRSAQDILVNGQIMLTNLHYLCDESHSRYRKCLHMSFIFLEAPLWCFSLLVRFHGWPCYLDTYDGIINRSILRTITGNRFQDLYTFDIA